MGKEIDITGQKFNRLTAIKFSHREEPRCHFWIFKCDCGVVKSIRKSHVVNNKTTSCGCYSQERKDKMKIGAITRNPIYNIWDKMKARCLNKNNPAYKYYGGRGIKICDRWLNSFENFLEDMGERPSRSSVDRIDNNKGYFKENCRWATWHQQSRNTRRNKNYTINGVTLCATDWAIKYNVNNFLVFLRLRRGWSIERALGIETYFLPNHNGKRHKVIIK